MKVEVVEVNEENALLAFNGELKLQSMLNQIAVEARSIVPDAETAFGRKEITSVAYKVSRSKTLIDSVGKNMVAGWKDKAKDVDAQRKIARDFLDNLRDEIRQPVTNYEEEQKRLLEAEVQKERDAQAARLAELERREAEIQAKEDAEFEREESARIVKERLERETRIAKEAAEQAKLDAEKAAAKEKADTERQKQDAIEAKERAEREKVEAQEKAENDKVEFERREKEAKELAEYRAEQAKLKAEADAKQAVETEKRRAQEEVDRVEREAKAREANIEHKRAINNEVLDAFISIGLTRETAKHVVASIASGSIPNVRISY